MARAPEALWSFWWDISPQGIYYSTSWKGSGNDPWSSPRSRAPSDRAVDPDRRNRQPTPAKAIVWGAGVGARLEGLIGQLRVGPMGGCAPSRGILLDRGGRASCSRAPAVGAFSGPRAGRQHGGHRRGQPQRDRSRRFVAECQAACPLPNAPAALGSYDELLADPTSTKTVMQAAVSSG